jgi:hypothetical protein
MMLQPTRPEMTCGLSFMEKVWLFGEEYAAPKKYLQVPLLTDKTQSTTSPTMCATTLAEQTF